MYLKMVKMNKCLQGVFSSANLERVLALIRRVCGCEGWVVDVMGE